MRRSNAVLVAVLLIATACSSGPTAPTDGIFDDPRNPPGQNPVVLPEPETYIATDGPAAGQVRVVVGSLMPARDAKLVASQTVFIGLLELENRTGGSIGVMATVVPEPSWEPGKPGISGPFPSGCLGWGPGTHKFVPPLGEQMGGVFENSGELPYGHLRLVIRDGFCAKTIAVINAGRLGWH